MDEQVGSLTICQGTLDGKQEALPDQFHGDRAGFAHAHPGVITGMAWQADPQRFGAARCNRGERAIELEGFTPEADLDITTTA